MKDLYIYYQVKEEHAQALEARVRALQAKLAAASGVAPQLKRRPEVKDGLQTWMEIYPVVGEGFAELLAAIREICQTVVEPNFIGLHVVVVNPKVQVAITVQIAERHIMRRADAKHLAMLIKNTAAGRRRKVK